MRKYLLAAVAACAISSPALAQDVGPYVGLEGGYIFKADNEFDIAIDGVQYDDALEIDYKNGYDFDAIAGYDFGSIRGELELGYKRLKIDDFEVSDDLIVGLGGTAGQQFTPDDLGVGDRVSVLSGMVNLLFDIGENTGPNFYAGGGVGLARVKALDEKETGFVWQLLAGVTTPVSNNVDVGLKYRFFNSSGDFEDAEDGPGFDASGRFSSHSLLASLIFKFGAPAAAPVYVAPAPAYVPPAPVVTTPAPVATQTCYDGTVIPATSSCPLPPQVPRAGERG